MRTLKEIGTVAAALGIAWAFLWLAHIVSSVASLQPWDPDALMAFAQSMAIGVAGALLAVFASFGLMDGAHEFI
jgi:hypothetical protein